MLSLRTIARAVPRSTSRLSTKVARSQLRAPAALSAPWKQTSVLRASAAFFSVAARRQGQVNDEIAAFLSNEIAYEQEQSEDHPEDIKEYLDYTQFELKDTLGHEEVHLTRKFGDESITVTFTVADLRNADAEDMDEMDPALYDEESSVDEIMGAQSGGANTKGAINQGRTQGGNVRVAPEDSVAPADRPELMEDELDEPAGGQDFPASVNVRIVRASKGALAVEAIAQSGEFHVQDVAWYPTPELAEAQTAEQDYERQGLYRGAPFGTLDENLQVLFDRYLEERGVNTAMANFIQNYINYKEQKEYVNWLQNIKKFVE